MPVVRSLPLNASGEGSPQPAARATRSRTFERSLAAAQEPALAFNTQPSRYLNTAQKLDQMEANQNFLLDDKRVLGEYGVQAEVARVPLGTLRALPPEPVSTVVGDIFDVQQSIHERMLETADKKNIWYNYTNERFTDLYETATQQNAQIITQGRHVAQLKGQSVADLNYSQYHRINDREHIDEAWWHNEEKQRSVPETGAIVNGEYDVLDYIGEQHALIKQQQSEIEQELKAIHAMSADSRATLEGFVYKGKSGKNKFNRTVTPDGHRNTAFVDGNGVFRDMTAFPDAEPDDNRFRVLIDGRKAITYKSVMDADVYRRNSAAIKLRQAGYRNANRQELRNKQVSYRENNKEEFQEKNRVYEAKRRQAKVQQRAALSAEKAEAVKAENAQ